MPISNPGAVAPVTLTAPTAATTPLVVKGAAAQSVAYQSWKTSADAEILSVGSGGNLTLAEATHLILGTTTGTKIGTATTQKIGFYNATPVVRPAGVADPASPGALYVQAEAVAVRDALVSVISRLESLGLIATL